MEKTNEEKEMERLLQNARKISRDEIKRRNKRRNLLWRIFKPTPDDLISEFGIRF